MIGHDELRRTLRDIATVELFGEDWRSDRPLESIGGSIGELIRSRGLIEGQFRFRAGYAEGVLDALKMLDEAYKKINEVPQTEDRP